VISGIHTREMDSFFRGLLDLEGFAGSDPSLNGIQVDNDGSSFARIAFAVDASLESFEGAAKAGGGLLFVHHGLFWGSPLRIEGNLRRRVKFLLDHNICLYAVHLPLDQHPELGNNAGLAELLGLKDLKPFGLYRGRKIGYKGTLAEPLTAHEAARKISFMNRPALGVYPFGKELNLTAAVLSGGGADEAGEAVEDGLDLYVTGEASHSVYHTILEGRLNMIAGGHYSTEVWGVRRVMERCAAELHIDTVFIDIPTGL
jgi:dinuclear metal center YbgI/SA1388 family protein